jgi:hypothetical protein
MGGNSLERVPGIGFTMSDDSTDSGGDTKETTDHETIRRWAEARDAEPATVEDTAEGDEPGVLRFDFEEEEPDEGLEHIGWDAFFDKFEENDLKMLYQERVESGETSRFFKFVSR